MKITLKHNLQLRELDNSSDQFPTPSTETKYQSSWSFVIITKANNLLQHYTQSLKLHEVSHLLEARGITEKEPRLNELEPYCSMPRCQLKKNDFINKKSSNTHPAKQTNP